MTRGSRTHRSRFLQLLLGAAPAILLAAATPADARSISGSLRTCERQDQRRAMDACSYVIQREDRATVLQVQRALVARANIRVGRNDLTGAAMDLESARRLGAENPATLVALGQVQARLNDPDAALANFGDAAAAATAQDRRAAYEAWIATGAIQLERQQWSQAIQSYSRAIEMTSSVARQARALIGRGHARLGVGDINGALDDYGDATARDVTSIEARLALADGYRFKAAQGHGAGFDTAQSTYAETISMLRAAPDSNLQRELMGRAYAGRGDLFLQRYLSSRHEADLTRARDDFEDAVEADSQNVPALVGRAAVYTQAPTGYQRAVADLDRAARLSPADSEIYRARGDLFMLIGNDERAMRDYDQSLQLGGAQTYRTHFQRGVIYLAAGDYVRAEQSFATAEALARHGQAPPGADPASAIAEALAMRSRATWNMIDLPGYVAQDIALRARNFADEAASLQPGQARYHAGRCLTRSVAGGEWNVAERACNDAIELARRAGDGAQLSEALGATGMLHLRWALSYAPNGAAEATHLQAATNFLSQAVDADSAPDPEGLSRNALYRYAQGVALECLGRTIEANGFMRAALNADRSVEAKFLSHRIRHCRT
jgi:tetratricopeptide (TPR) repeat protein